VWKARKVGTAMLSKVKLRWPVLQFTVTPPTPTNETTTQSQCIFTPWFERKETAGERTQAYSYSSFSDSTGALAAPVPLRLAAPNIGPRAGTTGANAIKPIGCATSS